MQTEDIFNLFRQQVESAKSKHLDIYRQIKKKVAASSAEYRGQPVEFLYQPMFFSGEDIAEFKQITARLSTILNKIITRYITDESFRKYFGFSDLLERLILADPGYGVNFPIGRFDIFYNGKQAIKFCELNTDGSSGMNEARALQNIFRESGALQAVEEKVSLSSFELFDSWLNVLLQNYRIFTGDREDSPPKPLIAIMDFKGEGVESEFREFKKRFELRGYQTIICDPSQLKYFEGKLYAGDRQIDLIYRRATTARLMEDADQITDFLNAYLDQAVCVVGGFRSQIVHNKILFAIMHDQEKVPFLDKEDREFIKKYIPYTRIFSGREQDSVQLIKNKDDYVLKPFDKYASHGVYIGRDYNQQEWVELMEKVSDEDYLLQKFCNVPRREMLTIKSDQAFYEQYNYIIGLYLYNQELSGLYTRVGRKNIIGSIVECYTLPNFITGKS